jgi:hypothetical protein
LAGPLMTAIREVNDIGDAIFLDYVGIAGG